MQSYQYFIHEGDISQSKKQNLKTQQLTPWENINTNIITNQFRKNRSRLNTEHQKKNIKKFIPKLKNMSHNYTRSKDEKQLYSNWLKRQTITTTNSPKQCRHLPLTKILQQTNLNMENKNTFIKKSINIYKINDQNQIYKIKNSEFGQKQSKILLENSIESNKKIMYQNEMKNIKIHRRTKGQIRVEVSLQNDWLRKFISKKFSGRHKNKEQLLYLPQVTKKLYEKYSFSKNLNYEDNHRIKLLPL